MRRNVLLFVVLLSSFAYVPTMGGHYIRSNQQGGAVVEDEKIEMADSKELDCGCNKDKKMEQEDVDEDTLEKMFSMQGTDYYHHHYSDQCSPIMGVALCYAHGCCWDYTQQGCLEC